MRSRAKDREKLLPSSVEDQVRSWQNRFRVSVIDGDSGIALTKLFWCGCDPIIVLNLLREYLGIGRAPGPFKESLRQWNDRIEKLCKRLSTDAEELQSIDDEYLRLELDLPRQIRRGVENLKSMITCEKSEVYGLILSRRAGRQNYLALAVRFVEAATKKPHYPELTAIVCALNGSAHEDDLLGKNVRKWEGSELFDAEQFNVDLRAIIAQNHTNLARLQQ